jgi:hypothetical protein
VSLIEIGSTERKRHHRGQEAVVMALPGATTHRHLPASACAFGHGEF